MQSRDALAETSWRWSSCSVQKYPRIGDRRHLVREGMSISWCGFSLARAAAWKLNSTKPECAECAELERKTAEREAWFARLGCGQ